MATIGRQIHTKPVDSLTEGARQQKCCIAKSSMKLAAVKPVCHALLCTCPEACLQQDLTWGSMSSGHRRALLTMMALSMEKPSLGKPSMTQLLILTGSPRTLTILKSLVQGIWLAWQAAIHCPMACSL